MKHPLLILALIALLAACGKNETVSSSPGGGGSGSGGSGPGTAAPAEPPRSETEKRLFKRTWNRTEVANSWTSYNYARNHGRTTARFEATRYVSLSVGPDSVYASIYCETELDREGGAKPTASSATVKAKVTEDAIELLEDARRTEIHSLYLPSHEAMDYACNASLLAGVYTYRISWDTYSNKWVLTLSRKDGGKAGVLGTHWRFTAAD